jgi:hypothetical protein
MVLTLSETRAVRKAIKQLPVKMLQLWLSGSSCMLTYIDMEEHYNMSTLYVSIPRLLFWMGLRNFPFLSVFPSTLPTLLWSLVVWIPPSALLSCPRKQLSSATLQADNVNTYVFSMKKADNNENFTGGRIVNSRIHHNSLCKDKNKH